MTILFDLDGTLIDSTEAILESFHHTFTLYEHVPSDDKKIASLIGYPLDVMYRELGVKEQFIEKFVDSYKLYYREIATQKTILLNGAKESIALASTFARLGVVTTKTARYSQELLEHFDVMRYFEVLIGREHVTHPKPHAEPILMAIDMMKCDKNRCWMIGDTKLDLISAKSAEIKSVGVTSGYDNYSELIKHSDHIYADSLEAVKFLQGRSSYA